jgi:hypothetical protein
MTPAALLALMSGEQGNFMAATLPGGIEQTEADGQADLCREVVKLPANGSRDPRFAEMGVVFGDEIPGDNVFRSATVPSGWKMQPTDHSYWSNLVDESGKMRATVFYKAAFYDRSARITVVEEK